MTTLIEAARQALEALETCMYPQQKQIQALTSLRQAIEQAEKQEPVAWMCSDESLLHKGYSRFSRNCEGAWNIPVYTTPLNPLDSIKSSKTLDAQPQQAEKQEPVCPYCHDSHTIGSVYYDQNCVGCVRRMATPSKCQWVGLTQEDIDIAFDDTQEGGGFNEFARAIEQTLRSKNS